MYKIIKNLIIMTLICNKKYPYNQNKIKKKNLYKSLNSQFNILKN